VAASASRPKYARLVAEVRRLIRSRGLAVGDGIPTEQRLAEEFGCSRGTVRRALDVLVTEGLIRRRQGSGHFVARPHDTSREALFGLIVPNILNAEILRLAQILTVQAGHRGFRVVLCVTSESPQVEQEFVHELRRLKVSGVIKFPTLPELPGFEAEIRSRLRSQGTPCVVVNDFWSDVKGDHLVAFDERAAVELAAEHLIGLGHRRVGWVDGSDGPRRAALTSLRNTLADHGLSLPEEHVLLCPPYETPPVARLWDRNGSGLTALVTPYDGMAVRLLQVLPNHGRNVPADVSIVNLNGQPLYSAAGQDLSTAVPPDEKIVGKVLDLLTDDSHEDSVCRFLFRPAFHVGRTTAQPPTDKCESQRKPEGNTHA